MLARRGCAPWRSRLESCLWPLVLSQRTVQPLRQRPATVRHRRRLQLGALLQTGHVLWYTDGASSNNQDSRFRRAGYGAICGYQHGHVWNISAALEGTGDTKGQTNNRAELRAVVAVLERDPRPVLLATDSAYVHDGAKRNLQRWRAQGWRRRAASPRLITNVDLWRRLHELLSAPGRSVQWRKVKGHATSADVAEGRVTQQDADGNACAD
eukprot:gene19372-biopygen9003